MKKKINICLLVIVMCIASFDRVSAMDVSEYSKHLEELIAQKDEVRNTGVHKGSVLTFPYDLENFMEKIKAEHKGYPLDNESQISNINVIYKDEQAAKYEKPVKLSKKALKSDIAEYFKLLKTKYTLYKMFPASSYETAQNNLNTWAEAKESYSAAEFQKKLTDESYFIVDGHFAIEGKHPVSYRNFIEKSWLFYEENEEYYTYYNGVKMKWVSFSDKAVTLTEYLDANGEISRIPCIISASIPENLTISLENTLISENVTYPLTMSECPTLGKTVSDAKVLSDSGLTYVYIPTWNNKSYVRELYTNEAKNIYKSTDIMVVDLSVNNGGYADLYYSLASILKQYKNINTIIILTGKSSASTSEIALLDLAHKYDCIVIGANTDGAFLTAGKMNYCLTNSKLQIGIPCAYRDKNLANPALADLECIGISPDILCDASSSQDLLSRVGKFLVNYGYATKEQVDAVLK